MSQSCCQLILLKFSARRYGFVWHSWVALYRSKLTQCVAASSQADCALSEEASVATVIDEPAAEVLRSPDMLSLGEKEEYVVRIHGVFKTNGACRVEILNAPKKKIVSGKIADDELLKPGNIYTRALNEGLTLRVVAQPTMKDRKINRLFITQGEIVDRQLV